ncbi:hypothetical protein LWI28_019714 [Acer negundo]|uniref:Uncharacterized protein n=1 Tax=Acer negundo TaxID=4023 RepID=A0AAD5P172_ACENE|nr:hypothetical protein LWI28_019714 [Acer negundo]
MATTEAPVAVARRRRGSVLGQMASTLVSPGAVPQIDTHHTIQMAEIEIDLQSTQAAQNQLMNRDPPEPNLPIPDLLPRQIDTIVVGLAGGGGPQIGSHDPVLKAESTDGHSTQAPQNQDHAPNYQINLPDRSLLPSECKNQDQYRLKCVPLQKAALTGNLEEAMPLLGDNPRLMLRTAITEWDETVLHIATGAKQVAFVEEIIELMKPDDLKLQDLNGSTAFCFAAAAGSIEIAKLMLDKNPDLLTLRGAKNMLPLYMAALFGRTEMAKILYDGTESHLTPQDEADLFFKSINTDMYDMASKLLQHQPQLAVTRDMHRNTALHVLARKPSSMFARGRTGLFKMITNSS